MKNNPTRLMEIAGIAYPPVGVYDVPETGPFEPCAQPGQCIFGSFGEWMKGKSTLIGPENSASFGCAGAGYWLCGIEAMPRADVAGYLAGQEGLKATTDLMCRWLEHHPPYEMDHAFIAISRLKDDQYAYLKTVTFWVNPDQLSLLLTGAEYKHAEVGRGLVTAPFGSGCGQLLPMFSHLDKPAAMIGATDIAMRKHLPRDVLAFTVTRAMFAHLCSLDDNSFLNKTFWKEVRERRNQQQEGSG